MEDLHRIRLTVNGTPYEATVEARLTLADFLRHHLGLTGTHVGCEHGVCGACTVLLNGRAVRSCLTLAVQAQGAEVMTVEGLTAGREDLHPIQKAFAEAHALQCGFCTPGFLMSIYELLSENPEPSEAEIREVVGGVLCRCTGYSPILEAARLAARLMRDEGS